MGEALPTSSEATVERDDDPAVICIDDERAETVLAALQSETARSVFRVVADEPVTQSEITDALDTSVQNVGYHVENLQEAGLIEVLDTEFSEKGREMEVYGASKEPIVLFLGSSRDRSGLRAAFSEFVPVLGPVAIVIAVKESVGRLLEPGNLLEALT